MPHLTFTEEQAKIYKKLHDTSQGIIDLEDSPPPMRETLSYFNFMKLHKTPLDMNNLDHQEEVLLHYYAYGKQSELPKNIHDWSDDQKYNFLDKKSKINKPRFGSVILSV
jgi:hypothetical protein